jgi:hypothetical protein
MYPQYFEMFLMKPSHLKNKVPGQNCCGLLVIIAALEMIDFKNKEKIDLASKKIELRRKYY